MAKKKKEDKENGDPKKKQGLPGPETEDGETGSGDPGRKGEDDEPEDWEGE